MAVADFRTLKPLVQRRGTTADVLCEDSKAPPPAAWAGRAGTVACCLRPVRGRRNCLPGRFVDRRPTRQRWSVASSSNTSCACATKYGTASPASTVLKAFDIVQPRPRVDIAS